MKFYFGKSQLVTGKLMSKYPKLAKILYSIFGYTNVGNYARSRVVIKLLNKLPLTTFKTVLDLGCGYGEFTFMIAEKLKNVKFTALDISKVRVKTIENAIKINNFSNIKTFNGKIEQMPNEELFDFIFSVDVFEHIYEEQMPFACCYQKLKVGGFLLVKIPNIKQRTILPNKVFEDHNIWLKNEHVGQVYDLIGLEQRFKEVGFKIIHKSYSDGIFSRIAWELGYVSKKAGSLFQLLFLPVCKSLIFVDGFFTYKKSGNAIQVIGQKIKK